MLFYQAELITLGGHAATPHTGGYVILGHLEDEEQSQKHISLEELEAKLEEFEEVLERAVNVSARARGKKASPRTGWATFIFARACSNAMSMLSLVRTGLGGQKDQQLLDHFAIASIARTLIEACIVSIYLSNKTMTFDRWLLVKAVIDLHDASHRHRIFKPMAGAFSDAVPMVTEFPEIRAMLRNRIRENSEFKTLQKDQKDALVSGREFLIGGIRSVVKGIGWDINEYDHIAAYLSAFVHSTPVSFHRADTHQIDFTSISGFQIGLSFTVFDWARIALESATEAVDAIIDNQLPLEAEWPELYGGPISL